MRSVAVIAHRGASAYAPENTPTAFALAVDHGADVLELDVRTTADGELVVLHDPTLARTTGDPRAITDVTARDLRALAPAVRPPRLTDILDRFGARAKLLVELKAVPPAFEASLVAAITERGLRRRTVLQSFDHLALRRIARAPGAPRLAALFPPEADVAAALPAVASFVAGVGPAAESIDERVVSAAHARGLAVRAWTVNDADAMRRLVDLGVDGLITDVPDVARAVVGPAPTRVRPRRRAA